MAAHFKGQIDLSQAIHVPYASAPEDLFERLQSGALATQYAVLDTNMNVIPRGDRGAVSMNSPVAGSPVGKDGLRAEAVPGEDLHHVLEGAAGKGSGELVMAVPMAFLDMPRGVASEVPGSDMATSPHVGSQANDAVVGGVGYGPSDDAKQKLADRRKAHSQTLSPQAGEGRSEIAGDGLDALEQRSSGPLTAEVVRRILLKYRSLSADTEVQRLIDEVLQLTKNIIYDGPGAVSVKSRTHWPTRGEHPATGGHTVHTSTGAKITLVDVPYMQDQIAALVHELVHVSVHARYGGEKNVDDDLLVAPGSAAQFAAYVRSNVVDLVRLLPGSGLPLGWRIAAREELITRTAIHPMLEYDSVLAHLLIWSDIYGDVHSPYHQKLGTLAAETRRWRADGRVTISGHTITSDSLELVQDAAVAEIVRPSWVRVPFSQGERATVNDTSVRVIESFAQDVAKTAAYYASRLLPMPEVIITGYGNGAWLPSEHRESRAMETGTARAKAVAAIFRKSLDQALDDLKQSGRSSLSADAVKIIEVTGGRKIPPLPVKGTSLESAAMRRLALVRVADPVSDPVVGPVADTRFVPEIVEVPQPRAGLAASWFRGFQVRRVQSGRREYESRIVVRVFLDVQKADDGSGPSPEQVREVAKQAQLGLDWHFNGGSRLPSGDRLWVELDVVKDPADAHYVVKLHGSTNRETAFNWSVSSYPDVLAHEIGHLLGLGDEYREASEGRRPVYDDGSLMAGYTVDARGRAAVDLDIAGLKRPGRRWVPPRHLRQLGAVIDRALGTAELHVDGEVVFAAENSVTPPRADGLPPRAHFSLEIRRRVLYGEASSGPGRVGVLPPQGMSSRPRPKQVGPFNANGTFRARASGADMVEGEAAGTSAPVVGESRPAGPRSDVWVDAVAGDVAVPAVMRDTQMMFPLYWTEDDAVYAAEQAYLQALRDGKVVAVPGTAHDHTWIGEYGGVRIEGELRGPQHQFTAFRPADDQSDLLIPFYMPSPPPGSKPNSGFGRRVEDVAIYGDRCTRTGAYYPPTEPEVKKNHGLLINPGDEFANGTSTADVYFLDPAVPVGHPMAQLWSRLRLHADGPDVTLFPEKWLPDEVLDAVEQARSMAVDSGQFKLLGDRRYYWVGEARGVRIEGLVRDGQHVVYRPTAAQPHPRWPNEQPVATTERTYLGDGLQKHLTMQQELFANGQRGIRVAVHVHLKLRTNVPPSEAKNLLDRLQARVESSNSAPRRDGSPLTRLEVVTVDRPGTNAVSIPIGMIPPSDAELQKIWESLLAGVSHEAPSKPAREDWQHPVGGGEQTAFQAALRAAYVLAEPITLRELEPTDTGATTHPPRTYLDSYLSHFHLEVPHISSGESLPSHWSRMDLLAAAYKIKESLGDPKKSRVIVLQKTQDSVTLSGRIADIVVAVSIRGNRIVAVNALPIVPPHRCDPDVSHLTPSNRLTDSNQHDVGGAELQQTQHTIALGPNEPSSAQGQSQATAGSTINIGQRHQEHHPPVFLDQATVHAQDNPTDLSSYLAEPDVAMDGILQEQETPDAQGLPTGRAGEQDAGPAEQEDPRPFVAMTDTSDGMVNDERAVLVTAHLAARTPTPQGAVGSDQNVPHETDYDRDRTVLPAMQAPLEEAGAMAAPAEGLWATHDADDVDILLGGFSREVRPAVRVWDGTVEPLGMLERILKVPRSRSLVFGTRLENPLWVISMEIMGTRSIRWFSLDAQQVPVPNFTDGAFVSIDIDHHGQLTGPAAQALKDAGVAARSTARAGFCDLSLGADLPSTLGWRPPKK
ncbi:hypothetical protein [Streptomyces sp. NPDC002547]